MRYIYDEHKNRKLKALRNISFEEIIELLETHGPLAIIKHHNLVKYPLQRIFVLEIEGYAWEIPYLKNDTAIILKTAYPSRKATEKFLRRRSL